MEIDGIGKLCSPNFSDKKDLSACFEKQDTKSSLLVNFER